MRGWCSASLYKGFVEFFISSEDEGVTGEKMTLIQERGDAGLLMQMRIRDYLKEGYYANRN